MASKANASPNITYNRRDVLGKGHYGVVFRGLFDGREVAVKRVLQEYAPMISNENEFLQLKHPNIVQLLVIEETEEFRFYAFDLAVENLDDFCRGKYSGTMPDDKEAMLQMAKGLEYIHSKQMIHCNLKPQNIRISKEVPTRLMIAVFGCCKKTGEGGYVSLSRMNETDEWIAPEVVEARQDRAEEEDVGDEDDSGEELHSVFSDIWTLGCLFFYFLTRGKHPFGNNSNDINWNMSVTRKPVELERLDLRSSVENYAEIIKSMVTITPTERERLNQVIYNLENVYVHAVAQGAFERSHLPEWEEQLQRTVHRLSNKVEELQHELKRTANMLEEKIQHSHEKIGHLNETAIRKKVTSDAAKRSLEYREIKSLTQLVKCYYEAKGTKSSEEDIDSVCRHVVSYLKKKKSEKHFCRWYHEEAIKKVKPKSIKDAISEHQIVNKKGNVNYAVTAVYKKSSFLRNYIDGPMTSDDWNNFSGTRSSILLLALFESLKDKKDLMSFPPPGILTMDIPVKISSAKNSVHIEIGEIKSSDGDAVRKARMQLKRSLLCFQWLDKIIETLQVDYYGLIGTIYIDGNRHSYKENFEDYEDEFTFKIKYETYT
ncbi:hypothetical protein OUZ56_006580 [Daphnia magna]|uniref:Protein kinase domain-containing protein n=1 Tax=Daphnia magna TaxID=35525 RepID=A0ABQ9YXE1_9CRUS|nr:hypothetical protein OUZ56_006580 [Daphnia magna]